MKQRRCYSLRWSGRRGVYQPSPCCGIARSGFPDSDCCSVANVLLPAEDLAGSLLPIGRLREPITSLSRADAIVLPGILPDSPELQLQGKSTWRARRVVDMTAIEGKAIAFSGIARPRQFLEGLKSLKLEIAGTLTFPDHHRYQQRDIDSLLALKKQTKADSFIATEKDLINLGTLSTHLSPLVAIPLRIELETPQQALTEVIRTLEQRSGQQIQPPA